MTELLSGVEAPSDAELISRVRGGDTAAYGELFSRHVEAARRLGRQLVRGPDVDDLVSEAFAKMLQILQSGGGPDVAFRAYLLTSVRRLHVDRIRAASKVQPSDDMAQYDNGVPFHDPAVANFENGAAAKAFSSLPERWQLVLWHLEVEGQKPADIAPLLGMSANSVSALAYRAREGLRQAFLTMHLADSPTEECRWVNEHLGAYVRKGLSRRDVAKVEGHLDECRRCTAMYLELNEVNSNLAAIIGPLLLGAAFAGYASSTGAAGFTGVSMILGRVRDAVTANVGITAGGAIAAGVAAVTTTAIVLGGGTPKEVITGADQPASIVQTPSGATSSSPQPGSPGASLGVGPGGTTPVTSVSSFSPASVSPPLVVPPLDVPVEDLVPPTDAPDGPDVRPDQPGQPGQPPATPTDDPTDLPTDPTDLPTDPTDLPTDPTDLPTDLPTDPTDLPTDPTDLPTDPTDLPTDPTDLPTDPTDLPTDPTDLPTDPTDLPTDPTDLPTDPTDLPTDPTDPPAVITANVSVSSATISDGAVHISASGDPALPPTIRVQLSSDPAGIRFAAGQASACTVDVSGTTATCTTLSQALSRSVMSLLATPPAGSTSFDASIPLDIPAEQPASSVTVSVSVPDGYEDPDPSNNTGVAQYEPPVVAPSDMSISLAHLDFDSSNSWWGLRADVVGVPAGADRLTLTLTQQGSNGPDARFVYAGAYGEQCRVVNDTTVTCTEPGEDFALYLGVHWPPGQGRHDITLTATSDPADLDPGNNSDTITIGRGRPGS